MDASVGYNNQQMQPQYGMQPAQPQYGMQPAQPQYGMQQQNPQYGGYPPQQQAQYGAPQQQYAPPQQNNPYAPDPNQQMQQTTTAPDPDAGKDVYVDQAEEEQEEKGDPWKFEPEWDDASELKAKTACCCCNCAFDDCDDWAQIQCLSVCLCLDSAITWKLFQCEDQSQRACCLNTQKLSLCDFTSEDPEEMCTLYYCGINGIFCLCCSGKAYESICDPCMMPETCLKQLCQIMCIHMRVALPCDEEQVPFEIACCGFMCYPQGE